MASDRLPIGKGKKLVTLYGHTPEVSMWAASRIGTDTFGACEAVGVLRDEKPIAAVVWHAYRHPMIEVSFAADRPDWATRGLLKELFAYPFGQLGILRINAVIDSSNEKAARLLKKLGFKLMCTLEEGGESGDVDLYSMHKRECKYWS